MRSFFVLAERHRGDLYDAAFQPPPLPVTVYETSSEVGPHEEAAEAAITDAELALLFGPQAEANEEMKEPTEVQEVLGGAAATGLRRQLAGLETTLSKIAGAGVMG